MNMANYTIKNTLLTLSSLLFATMGIIAYSVPAKVYAAKAETASTACKGEDGKRGTACKVGFNAGKDGKSAAKACKDYEGKAQDACEKGVQAGKAAQEAEGGGAGGEASPDSGFQTSADSDAGTNDTCGS